MDFTKEIATLTLLNIGSRHFIALVVLGIKPSTEVDIFPWNATPQECKNTLETIGLTVVQLDTKPNGKELATFCVSKIPQIAETLQLVNSVGENNLTFYDQMYGTLMGFPLSAIYGYVENQRLPEEKYPEDLINNPSIAFFILSKNNWREEYKIMQSWQAALKQHAPDIYNEMLPQ